MSKKYDYLILRRKLYSVVSELGNMAEILDLTPLNETYQDAASALDKYDEYGVSMGYIDQDTLSESDIAPIK